MTPASTCLGVSLPGYQAIESLKVRNYNSFIDVCCPSPKAVLHSYPNVKTLLLRFVLLQF